MLFMIASLYIGKNKAPIGVGVVCVLFFIGILFWAKAKGAYRICEVIVRGDSVFIKGSKNERIVPKSDVLAASHGMSAFYTLHLKSGEQFTFISTVEPFNIGSKDILIQKVLVEK